MAPIGYGPVLLLMPFGFHLAMDTLPSAGLLVMALGSPWLVSSFRFRARLGVSWMFLKNVTVRTAGGARKRKKPKNLASFYFSGTRKTKFTLPL